MQGQLTAATCQWHVQASSNDQPNSEACPARPVCLCRMGMAPAPAGTELTGKVGGVSSKIWALVGFQRWANRNRVVHADGRSGAAWSRMEGEDSEMETGRRYMLAVCNMLCWLGMYSRRQGSLTLCTAGEKLDGRVLHWKEGLHCIFESRSELGAHVQRIAGKASELW